MRCRSRGRPGPCTAVQNGDGVSPFAALIEVILGTGLRKGEALRLHWGDVHLDEAAMLIRCTPSARGPLDVADHRHRGRIRSPRFASRLRHHTSTGCTSDLSERDTPSPSRQERDLRCVGEQFGAVAAPRAATCTIIITDSGRSAFGKWAAPQGGLGQ